MIQNYWTTRPFNQTPIENNHQYYPSAIDRKFNYQFTLLFFKYLVSLSTALSWSIMHVSAVDQQQKVIEPTDSSR